MFRRQTPKLRFILAMLGMTGFVLGSGSLVNGAASPQSSTTDEIEVRVSNDEPSGTRVGSLAFRSARRPILVPISFAITDGKPRIQDDASAIVLEQLREHPRRLITIEVEGLPIAFNLLPRSTRGKLLERGGAGFPAKYDQFVARELVSLLDAVRAEKPKSPLSIQGLPFDRGGRIDSSPNQRFAPVISRLSAFVLDRGVVVSSRSDEQAVFARMFPNAIGMADGRAVIFPLNLGWRLAIEGESLATEEKVSDSDSDELDDLEATGEMAKARSTASPVMSDLEDLGIAGRGGERPMTGAVSSRGRPTGSSQASSSSPGGNAGAAAPSGGGGGGGALPFGRSQQQASAEEDNVADEMADEAVDEADAGGAPPADDDAGGDPPADEGDDEDPPADEGDDEDPPADEGDDEDPPADEGDDEDPPADEGDDEDPPADEGDDEDPPADEGDDEDPPADEGDDEDPPADDGDDEDPPADEGDDEDPPADEGDDEDPPADEGDDEDPPADEGDDEDPPADDGDDSDPWDPSDEVDDDPPGEDDGAGSNDESDDSSDPPEDDDPSDDDSSSDNPGDHNQGEIPEDVGAGPVETWESWATLKALIASTVDGGTLDLRGRGFAPEFPNEGWVSNDSKSLTILGGNITGAISVNWNSEGGGLFSAGLDLSWLSDWRTYLIDSSQESQPRLKVFPEPPTAFDPYRLSRNPNWFVLRSKDGSVVKGTVQTTGGDNVVGETITGFTITDPDIRAAVSDQIASAGGLASTAFTYLSSDNRTIFALPESYDPVTGELDFSTGGLTYYGYLHFAMLGGSNVGLGEYSFDPANNRIWYRPKNGDPSQCRVPSVSSVFRFYGADKAVTFDGSTISGGLVNAVGNSSLIAGPELGDLILKNTLLHSAKSGVYGMKKVDLERCIFTRFERYGIQIGGPESRIVNCVVRDTESSSGIYCSGVSSDPLAPIGHFLVKDCFFYTPASGHGQGITLGNDTWQNATFENCIFFNCSRAFAFQPSKKFADRHVTPGTFKFNNNLVVTTSSVYGDIPNGQAMVAFNGASDEHLTAEQKVEFRHNTIFVDETILDGATGKAWMLYIGLLRRSTVTLESNIMGIATAAAVDDGGPPQLRFANQLLFPYAGWAPSWGASDLPDAASTASVFNRVDLTPLGIAATAAADGGPIGIRWSEIPTAEQLRSLSVDWCETFTPQSPPRATTYSQCYGGQDWR